MTKQPAMLSLVCLLACSAALAGPAFDFSASADGFQATGGEATHDADRQCLRLSGTYPGLCGITRELELNGAARISFDVRLPEDAPFDLQPLLFLKDKDGLWFQARSKRLARGAWQTVEISLAAGSARIMPYGHEAAWSAYYAGHVTDVGVKFFSASDWQGTVLLDNLRLHAPKAGRPPLRILDLEQLTAAPRAYERFALAFSLSRPPANPFDPETAAVDATVRTPSGKTVRRPCFFHQPFRRELGADEVERLTLTGRGGWRMRFTPLEAGRHTWQLVVRVDGATLETREHAFDVAAGEPRGFVRVSRQDPRCLETADGAWFYPIGQNIHAPFDKRCARMLRVPMLPNKGTFAYDHYFEKMAAHGENAVIVWMANWWVSIEWTEKWKGFHGLTDFHLGNAWRLDYLLDAAARRGIHVLLVLDNHGKFSGFVDSEWQTNPYSRANRGPCLRPEQFFQSSRAFDVYRKRLRYIIARWGAHPHLMGLEIISEMNLVGSDRKFKGHPSHAAWVKRVADYLETIDAYDRPLAVQYSNDWRAVDERVASLPELDLLVGDAYKAGGSIVPLMVKTAQKNTRFHKPTFSAEFGGNWNGTTPQRLHADLHAGLWANAMTNTAGAPFFWWFDYVDRYDLYSEFQALANFMKGEDRRALKARTVELPVMQKGQPAEALGAVALVAKVRAWFWVYEKLSSEVMPEAEYARTYGGIRLTLPATPADPETSDPGRDESEPALHFGLYRIAYWDTVEGAVTARGRARAGASGLSLVLPDFRIDLAGKVRMQP